MDKEVQVKNIDDEKAVVIKYSGQFKEFDKARMRIVDWIEKNHLKVSGYFHLKINKFPTDSSQDTDYELKIPINDKNDSSVKITEYPEHDVVSVIHKGPYEKLPSVYRILAQYAKDNDLEVVDVPVDIYLNSPFEVKANELLTEVKLNVKPHKFKDIKLEKEINKVTVAKDRVAVITHDGPVEEVAKVQNELFNWCRKNNISIGANSVRFHKHPNGMIVGGMSFDVRISVGDKDVKEEGRVKIVEIPEHEALTAIYKGSYENLSDVAAKMKEYARKNSYDRVDYVEEIFLNSPFKVKVDELLTEIRIPIVHIEYDTNLEFTNEIKKRTMKKSKIVTIRHEGPLEEISNVRMNILKWARERDIKTTDDYFVKYYTHPYSVTLDQMIFVVGFYIKDDNSIKIINYPKHKALSVIHKGPYNELKDIRQSLVEYAKENGYEVIDNPEDIYRNRYIEVDEDDLITEIQLPIKDPK